MTAGWLLIIVVVGIPLYALSWGVAYVAVEIQDEVINGPEEKVERVCPDYDRRKVDPWCQAEREQR